MPDAFFPGGNAAVSVLHLGIVVIDVVQVRVVGARGLVVQIAFGSATARHRGLEILGLGSFRRFVTFEVVRLATVCRTLGAFGTATTTTAPASSAPRPIFVVVAPRLAFDFGLDRWSRFENVDIVIVPFGIPGVVILEFAVGVSCGFGFASVARSSRRIARPFARTASAPASPAAASTLARFFALGLGFRLGFDGAGRNFDLGNLHFVDFVFEVRRFAATSRLGRWAVLAAGAAA